MRTGAWRAALAVLLAGALGPSAGAATKSFPDLPTLVEATTPPDPARIRVHYLGISTLLFDDGETQILVDGFISRPKFWDMMLFGIEPDKAKIDGALREMIGDRKVAAVLVAHAHYDHAMDAPYIAGKHGAKLVGSPSVGEIKDVGRAGKLETWVPAPNEVITCGRFNVTVLHGPHAKGNFYRGEIKDALTPPARGARYKASDSYAFLIENNRRTILVQPSANLPMPPRANPEADIVFLSVGMLGWRSHKFAEKYWNALVGEHTDYVIPIHWDNPIQPAAAQKPTPFPDRVKNGLQLIKAQDGGGKLRRLPVGAAVDLDLSADAARPVMKANPPTVCSRSNPPPA